ncbi:MAG: Asp-tRNA(Asn)/Glu-tRNA(Gln) amidotransferase subunit GatB [Spirochaetia bacterium]|nr:MAG: Asp-tRNA(Asn)/Glu-tRNA(Gln) amidotransferase subunit GatB [Spirochaetia bacterium]
MYELTIGLEIHTELKTKTKMFCGCLNDPEEKHPNVNICHVCMGHPGTLPTINKKAVEAVLKLGMALNGKLPETSKFDRKNYFYPDLPKGYQISQFDKPLVIGGELNGVRITRVHLEEDTARLTHDDNNNDDDKKNKGHSHGQKSLYSLVDFNRAGVPLMELVTEPDIKSGEEAIKFAKELQLILRHLEISNADMEKGQMRVEVNISLMRTNFGTNNTNEIREISGQISENSRVFGTKVEIKNLNSFRSVEESIKYEIERQSELLEKGEKIVQETRGWDDVKKRTVSQRLKEESHDYRYFPEPDLPPMNLKEFDLETLKVEIPELPVAKRKRFMKEYGLSESQAEALIEDRNLAKFFEESVSEFDADSGGLGANLRGENIQLFFNYLTSDIKGLMSEQKIAFSELKITPENFADLLVLIIKGDLSSRLAKDILKEMYLTGLDPNKIIEEKGLKQISGENELKPALEEIVKENPEAVSNYKKGKETALQFLIGQAMAKLKGKGNPEILKKILKEIID